MNALFARHPIDATMHFAAFKAVGESVIKPMEYYANNIGGLLTVCRAMQLHGVQRFAFSSSATVYGDPTSLPITETAALSATSPYGQTKLIGETILRDLGTADASWQTACLRYFNPVGAHESGRIGEDPRGTPNNLMPCVAQVAVGRRPHWRCCAPTPLPAGVICPIGCCPGALAMWPPAMPTPHWHGGCSAGRRNTTWPACAPTAGVGSR